MLQVYHYYNRNNQQNANHPQHGNAAAGQNPVQAQPAAGHAAAAAAAGAADGTAVIGFQPYIRPPMFTFKVMSL